MQTIPQLQNLREDESFFSPLKAFVANVLREEYDLELEPEDVEITRTQDDKFGDLTTNVALRYAKELQVQPREIAQKIVESIAEVHGIIHKAEIAGPGFINFYFNPAWLVGLPPSILTSSRPYGSHSAVNGQVMVEFGQPNTHKAVTVGHVKSWIVGLCVCRMLESIGYKVIQTNYFGDVGLHTAKSTWAFLKRGKPDDFDSWNVADQMKYIAEGYVYGNKQYTEDETAREEIKQINKKIYAKSDPELYMTYLYLKELSIRHQEEVENMLGVDYHRQYPESEVASDGVEIIKNNIGKVFTEDQGAVIFEGEKYGLNRWVFLTSEGLPSYSGKDMGLAFKKYHEYPNTSIFLHMTSVEQNDYFKALFKAVELVEPELTGKYFHLGFGWLLMNNKKFSSRLGNAPSGIDVVEETISYSEQKISETKTYSEEETKRIAHMVGIAGLKFLILSHEFHKDSNYDPDQFLDPEGFSGPYIMYAYVRTQSILKQEESIVHAGETSQGYEPNGIELRLLKELAFFPQVTFDAAKTISPHKIAHYLFNLAQLFNQFYRENKVITDDQAMKTFRLQLTQSIGTVLNNGMYLLGIETINRM